jgi:hypothetical protein
LYAILAATAHDYMAFAEREMQYRRWMRRLHQICSHLRLFILIRATDA